MASATSRVMLIRCGTPHCEWGLHLADISGQEMERCRREFRAHCIQRHRLDPADTERDVYEGPIRSRGVADHDVVVGFGGAGGCPCPACFCRCCFTASSTAFLNCFKAGTSGELNAFFAAYRHTGARPNGASSRP